MKLFFDLFPVIVFFIGIKVWGIKIATIMAIVASVLQIVWLLARKERVTPMNWISFVLIVVFGGAAVFLDNPIIFKWKPSILSWISTLIFLGAPLIKKNPLKSMLGKELSLPDPVWTKLNIAWGGFFFVLGALNLYVAYTWSDEIWADFKLFGITGLTILFTIIQSFYIAPYIKEAEPK